MIRIIRGNVSELKNECWKVPAAWQGKKKEDWKRREEVERKRGVNESV